VLAWSRDDLTARLVGVCGDLPGGDEGGAAAVAITKVASVEGEAYLTTRKGGKKFAAYDLSLSLEWEVRGGGSGEGDGAPSTSGSLKVTEVSLASDPDDVLFEVSGGGGGGATPASAVTAALKPGILAALEAFAAALDQLDL